VLDRRLVEDIANRLRPGGQLRTPTGAAARAPADPTDRFALMIERLSTDRVWADEYEEFVHNVSFARPDEEISFTASLDATWRLVEIYKRHRD
jgi:hypothetical protein